MKELPLLLQNAIEGLKKLPGIGPKSAVRLALSISNFSKTEILEIGNNLSALTDLRFCRSCHFFADDDICDLCQEEARVQAKSLCIVEGVTDLIAIENSGSFNGLYHVLGGVLNPLMGVGPEQLKIELLMKRVSELGIQEILLALNPSVEGDATCSYLKSLLSSEIVVNRIGFGIPIGGSLEFLDKMTISKALENRRILS